MEKGTSRLYEASYILSGGCSEEEALKEDEKIKSMVAQNQALIMAEAKPRRQRLAYPVKKTSEGHFGWVRFSAEPEYFKKIKNELDKNNLIVKMLVKIFKNLSFPKESPTRPQKIILPIKETEKTSAIPESLKSEAIKTEEIDRKLEEILGS